MALSVRTIKRHRHRIGDHVSLVGAYTARLYRLPIGSTGTVLAAEDDQYNACRVDFGDAGEWNCWGSDLVAATHSSELAPTG